MDLNWLAITTGFVTGLGLIVAIGAQNAYVLRQGIRREHVAIVVAICALSDAVLILAGTAGMGALLQTAPWVVDVMRWLGVAYLLWFAFRSVRSALKPAALEGETDASGSDVAIKTVVLTTLGLTWLNPHVYLDTVIMLGTIASTYGAQRWVFAAGAVAASIVWFTVLGFGAQLLAPYLKKPIVWRVIDVLIAVVMVLIAIKLAFFYGH